MRHGSTMAASALFGVLTSTVGADFVGAVYEVVDVGAPAGHTTYRLYLRFDTPTDQLLAVGTGQGEVPVAFSATSGLANEGGDFSGLQAEDLAGAPISADWDSWVTIGADELAGNNTQLTPFFAGGDGVVAVIVGASWSEDNGGWYDSNPLIPALAGPDGRILIGQFTVADEPDGTAVLVLAAAASWQKKGRHRC